MRFALCRAVARCQARRLRAVGAAAPLPAAIVAILVALAPLALARVGDTVGEEFAGTLASADVATALVLGPFLAAAAAGAVIAVSLPTRAGLGQQVAAGPCGDLAALVAGLLFPAVVVTLTVLPSLVTLCLTLAGGLGVGYPAGLAFVIAIVAAIPAGAVVAEGVQAATRGLRLRSSVVGIGVGVWAVTGAAMGAAPLGPLAPVGGALRGSESAWSAVALAGGVAACVGAVWVGLAARRPERPSVARRRRHLEFVWCLPVPAAVASLVGRRHDVRLANAAALGFGAVGALVAVAADAAAPGPFLLATTTSLLGSVVAALSGWGVLAAGGWMWLGAPRRRRSIAVTTWHVLLFLTAVPVGFASVVAALGSGASWRAAGVIAVLVVGAAAVATVAGSFVPWSGNGIGDQLGSFATFIAVAIAASLLIGVLAPRLIWLGLSDPAVAVLVCVTLASVAVWSLLRRLVSC